MLRFGRASRRSVANRSVCRAGIAVAPSFVAKRLRARSGWRIVTDLVRGVEDGSPAARAGIRE
jgi:hypothetical protein